MRNRTDRTIDIAAPRIGAHCVNDLEGYVDLGMKRDALRLARRILRQRQIHAREFNAAVDAILVQADRVKQWKTPVEQAHARLSNQDQRAARSRMFGFYASLEDWASASAFVPARAKTGADLLFSMWTFLNLRRLDAAKSVRKRCLRMLRQSKDTFTKSALLEALASYHAQIGELGTAEECWIASAGLEPFSHNAQKGLVEIAVVQAQFYVVAGLLQIEAFRKRGVDEQAISLPHNRDGMLDAAERDLKRLDQVLEKIVPPEDLWRFGIGGELD